MLSKIEQVEMLIALGKGDKYRLMNIRQSLESGKELFISDKDFLQDLIKTHLGDKIYQARVVSVSKKPNLFCEECGSEISADEKFCTSCGTEKLEPETKQEAGSGEQQASGGFAFTADGDVGESSTRETAREGLTKKISELETKLDEQTKATSETTPIELKLEPKKKSRQQELEEYEKKHPGKSKTKVSRKTYNVKATRKTVQIKLKPEPKKKSRQQELEEYEKKYLNESATKVTWKAYDVKAKRKVEIQNPKAVKMKNGKWAVKGTSPITGIKVFRIVGNEKPAVSGEKTADSPKVKKEQTAPAEKPKGSQKTEPEVFSRYYRSPEDESPKVKKSKSKKPNPFCEECGSKIPAKDMFCTNCGAKR
ncbi:zinc ribbon domain-containing protein [Marine Group I thaumarchaeote]|uniref:Zinc ribbon domain-containing protein n=1 Tax=Marine Group I thaumarchaeote TaxID=2511932 RepID=A0A7K4N1N1_9ARCH|nr:zinc ribbon domain-containing protein [Marine Group I thaumarchaeote]